MSSVQQFTRYFQVHEQHQSKPFLGTLPALSNYPRYANPALNSLDTYLNDTVRFYVNIVQLGEGKHF